jgi:hypothetical protein
MTSRRSRATLRPGRLAAIVLCAICLAASHAEEPARSTGPGVSAPALVPARPYWPELTVAQRQALAPLADDWERLDLQTKKKWVEIAKRYPTMQPDEQARTRDRMREWARLTPEQRRVARDSFARMRAMPPEQRAEMLRKYQELPDAKKQALATEGRVAKPLIVPRPMPAAAPVPRRAQIREGTKVSNPAIAAQKSASPVVRPAPPKPAPPASAPTTAPSVPAAAAAPTS